MTPLRQARIDLLNAIKTDDGALEAMWREILSRTDDATVSAIDRHFRPELHMEDPPQMRSPWDRIIVRCE